MKKIINIVLALCAAVATMHAAQPAMGWDIFEVGVQGGGTVMTGGKNFATEFGYTGGLNMNYRYLTQVADGVEMGPKIGLGASYNQARLRSLTDTWIHSSPSEKGITMVDTLHLRGKESLAQWQVELPVMLAMNVRGCVINIGVIPALSLQQQHLTQLDNPQVNTSFVDYDVVLPHTLVMRDDKARIHPQFRLMVGAEIGYEWSFKQQHRLGLQAFCRYDVLPMQPWSKDPFCEWQQNQLVVGSLTQVFADKLHSLDFGIRLYYAFASPHNYRRLGLYLR